MATPYPTAGSGPPVSSTPSSKVELHISCKNLCDADVFSKSDPIVAIYTVDNGGKAVEVMEIEHYFEPVSSWFHIDHSKLV